MSNARSPEEPAPPYEAIRWRDGTLSLLDQTRLPWAIAYVHVPDVAAAAEAIRTMVVRGAPAIGITAAYALALETARVASQPLDEMRAALDVAATSLGATRPTAVNLRWAIEQIRTATEAARTSSDFAAMARAAAESIHAEQHAADAAMARAGVALLESARPSTVITHCNTGPLATGGLGTALGVIIAAHRRGLVSDVLVDETRPRLQGARLTSWELQQHGVPHHVIADGAAASLIPARGVAAAFVGADRIAANGDTANKVGTFALALACQYHKVPFYVVAPLSSLDPATPEGTAIAIEERDEAEVLAAEGARLAAPEARALNPAFDVTPGALITAIITEAGVLRPPFASSITAAFDGDRRR